MYNYKNGVFPTMITPYNEDMSIDFGAVRELTRWYYECGCEGVFAACQSSEIFFLTLKERAQLVETVRDEANALAEKYPYRPRLRIMASGHISEGRNAQAEELKLMCESGADCAVFITNRIDRQNVSEQNWIDEALCLVDMIDPVYRLGLYECPLPYKRIVSAKMLKILADTGRFAYMKDTCCDMKIIREKLNVIGNSEFKLLNANSQTLLESLRCGAYGYSSVMSNFHPELYVWLIENYKNEPEKAEKLQAFLCMAAFTESLNYPLTAKYHLKKFRNIDMRVITRNPYIKPITDYDITCLRQMELLAGEFASWLGIKKL